jgi:hypothetical protein
MVSGPMHYTEAESALDQSAQVPPEMALLYATQAVAHATLALAAATIDMTNVSVTVAANLDEWIEVTK